ncbi:MAG: hypothetical protein KJO00_03870, partial [Bacteroidia bacterium]|nr:hypothetical protein [Bacteroidia bacterium]
FGRLMKGRILIDQGKVEEGLEILKTISQINIAWRYWAYGPSLAQTGRYEEAQKIVDELENAPKTPFGSLCAAIIYGEMGNEDKAIEWLQYEQKHGWYPWIRVYVKNEKLKNDPRFLKLIREMNLPDPSPYKYDPDA